MLRALMERRSLSLQAVFNTGIDTLGYTTSFSGVSVDQDNALSFNAVWACVRLLAGDISTLPVDAYRKGRDGSRKPLSPTPSWLLEPDPLDPSTTLIDHLGQVAISLLLDGNAFIRVTPSVLDPIRLEVLNPRSVKISSAGMKPTYSVTNSRGATVGEAMNSLQIVHIRINTKPGDVRGISPVMANQEAIGIGLAAERYIARFFGAGMTTQGFIEVPGDPTTPQLDEMRGLLEKKHGGWRKAHAFGFLTGGAKFTPTTISPKDADLTGLLKFQLEQAARAYGIPPFMVGSQEPAGVAYASSVERAQAYIDHALIHYLRPIEAAYARLVPGDGRLAVSGTDTYVKFNLDAMLRGDIKSRYEAYGVGLSNKFLFIEDVWAKEDLDPTREGTLLETPNNNGPRDPAPPAAPPVTNNSFTIPAEVHNHIAPAEVHTAPPEIHNHVDARTTVEPGAMVHNAAPITIDAPPAANVTVDTSALADAVASAATGNSAVLTRALAIAEKRDAPIVNVYTPDRLSVDIKSQPGVRKTVTRRDGYGRVEETVEHDE